MNSALRTSLDRKVFVGANLFARGVTFTGAAE